MHLGFDVGEHHVLVKRHRWPSGGISITVDRKSILRQLTTSTDGLVKMYEFAIGHGPDVKIVVHRTMFAHRLRPLPVAVYVDGNLVARVSL